MMFFSIKARQQRLMPNMHKLGALLDVPCYHSMNTLYRWSIHFPPQKS